MKTFNSILISTRPSQWVKNLAVFAAIFFGGKIFDLPPLQTTTITFVAFCFAAASTYLFNDLIDSRADLLHKVKKNRPIAAGKIPRIEAIISSVLFASVSLALAYTVSKTVFLTILLYLAVQIAYNLQLKKIILLELLIIAFGFMIRIFAGSFASGVALSSWLILTVMMASLFLAIGKRRSEITLLGDLASSHRSALAAYPINLLDGLVYMSATASLITYSLFTFNQPINSNSKLLSFLPPTLASPKWLMVTIPIVVYSFFRYLYIVFEKKEGDSPEKILLTDKPLFLSLLLWFLVASLIIYFLPST